MSTKINTTLAALRRSGGSVARDAIETLAAVATERDALLAALQNAADMLEYPSDHAVDWHQSAIKCLRAAIAKAVQS